MSDHLHYEYAEARHDHRGEFADSRHDHDPDYAGKHHRHYDDERAVEELRGQVRELRAICIEFGLELSEAQGRVHQLEGDFRGALERIGQLERLRPTCVVCLDVAATRQTTRGPVCSHCAVVPDDEDQANEDQGHPDILTDEPDDEDQAEENEPGGYHCPDCGRASCTGEECYWPDEAGIARPQPEVNTMRTYTHPDVFTAGVEQGWAEAETDPVRIDWAERQARAAIPFEVVNGRPVNPCEKTAVRYGRNEMGFWGENLMADALVTITYEGARYLLMVERGDGRGWAVPGGHVEDGETGVQAAVRELAEETGLTADPAACRAMPPRYVPDPRASDEAWAVTIPVRTDLGHRYPAAVTGGDDARQAAWMLADDYDCLVTELAMFHDGGRVFAAHVDMLREFLGAGEVDKDQDDERRPLAELIRAAAGQSCSYCQASPGVPCDPPAGYHAARFLGLLASRAESETVADAATGSGGLVTRIVREVAAVANGQDDDRAECGCPKVPGQIRHQCGTCTDPVVARLNWYANGGEAGQP